MNRKIASWRFPGMCPTRTAAVVMDETAKAFGLSKSDLLGRSRHQRVAWARQIAMALTLDLTGCGQSQVGKMYRRDHGTVAWAIKTVENLSSSHSALREELDKIRRRINERIRQFWLNTPTHDQT